ncbi:MAG: hypothetical protein ACYS7Y_33365 [Planctomycetota bacterium]|jgi:hypothetical protein
MRGTRAKQLRRLAYQDAPTKSRLTEYSGQRIVFKNPFTKGDAGTFEMMQLTSTGPRREYRRLKGLYKLLRTIKVHKRAPLPRERRFRKEAHASIS